VRDLAAWATLLGEEPPAETLLSALRDVAALELPVRWPFLVGVERFARHPDPRVRQAVLAALAGYAGLPVARSLEAGLGDGHAEVRAAAARAALLSARKDAGLWGLVLFHPDPELRRLALQRQPESAVPGVWLRLLADPDTAVGVRERVDQDGLSLEALPILAQHLRAGHAEPDWALGHVARLRWRHHLKAILDAFGPGRKVPECLDTDPAALAAYVAPLARQADGLDQLCVVLVEPPEAGREQARAVLLAMLDALGTGAATDHLQRRLGGSLLVCLEACGGPVLPEVLACAALLAPGVLGWRPYGQETRRAAARALAWTPRRWRHLAPPADLGVEDLVDPSGPVDLEVLAGLVALTCYDTFATLVRSLSQKALVDALVARPQAGARLLSLVLEQEAESVGMRRRLLLRALERHGAVAAPLTAAFALRAPDPGLQLLRPIHGSVAVTWLRAFDEEAGVLRLSGEALSKAAAALVQRLEQPLVTVARALERKAMAGPVSQLVLISVLKTESPRRIVRTLGVQGLERLAALDQDTPLLPWPVVEKLATACRRVDSDKVRVWLGTVGTVDKPQPRPEARPRRMLSDRELRKIRSCLGRSLGRAVAPALSAPLEGLTAALAGRRAPSGPQAEVCAALLVCPDAPADVAAQLSRFGLGAGGTSRVVDQLLVSGWTHRDDLGPSGGAWLHRWERPILAFSRWLDGVPGGLPAVLEGSLSWQCPELRGAAWSAARQLLARWRWREKGRLASAMTAELAELLVVTLSDRGGPRRGALGYPTSPRDRDEVVSGAAQALAVLHGGGMDLTAWRPRAEAAAPGLPSRARQQLARWTGATVLPPRRASSGSEAPPPADAISRIEGATDPPLLVPWVLSPARGLAELAVLRLLELGEGGARGLLEALLARDSPHRDLLSKTLSDWPDGPALEAARAACRAVERDPEIRFHVALGLLQRGTSTVLPPLLEAVCTEVDTSWLVPGDLARLREQVSDEELAFPLAAASQPVACQWAVDWCRERAAADERALAALQVFLERGTTRPAPLRIRAAETLRKLGDSRGLPLLLAHRMTQGRAPSTRISALNWSRDLDDEALDLALRAMVMAGTAWAPISTVIGGLSKGRVPPAQVGRGALVLLQEARSIALQQQALKLLQDRRSQRAAARRLAATFLWGADQSRKLLGRAFAIRMIGGRGLGWTRLEGRSIHVNPLPLLRGERDGEALVRGLIVHELGHHIYNADPEGLAIWKQAQDKHLASLHNLVCDEHLERNLRARERGYGDDLKRLSAWAFQHGEHATQLADLCNRLGVHSAPALIRAGLRPGRETGTVLIELGQLYRALEAAGSSFARFVRALRMGLGDRFGDPRVTEALALFKGRPFRELDNPGLWEVTQELRRIFGVEVELLDVLGLHEVTDEDVGDTLVEGRGVSDEQIQREVERLDSDRLGRPSPRDGEGGGDAYDGGGRQDFERIPVVVPLVHDPSAHAALALEVRRPARLLRETFSLLGLTHRPVRGRSRGYRVDRARLLGTILRRDPRFLMARERVIAADLFVGVVVDCSGSMVGTRMDKAIHFATMLAEAARGLAGVDLRIFGFTDYEIYDAGDADRCAAHALVAGGGNNDAAGLWHAAQQALASPRSARLLVMISDGLPTECTTTALRALVQRLGRRHQLVCAQIAVHPLTERCFEHYVEVLDDDVDDATRRFCRIIGDLVIATIRG